MAFSGAKAAELTGENRQTATSSYFLGNDSAKWVTRAPNYARVRYRGLYPGIDLVFYGNQRRLEYDLVVAPGADPGAVRLQFDGVDRMYVDNGGDLVLSTGTGDVRQHRPVIYQENGGARQPVAGRYVVQPHNRVAFEIARYDRGKPLVIDPVLTFATYLGSPGQELWQLSEAAATATYPAIAVDFQGSVYLTGFNGGNATNFPGHPVTLGPGGSHVFVVKMNSAGTALLYSVVLGGGLTDVGGGIAVDASGNAYITGYTNSTNFPVTAGAPQSALNSSNDAFITKLNAAGSAIVYSTYLGGNGDDRGRAIAVDRSGHAYATGATGSTTGFPSGSLANSGNGFLAEMNDAGTAFVYFTYLSGIGYGIAVDSGENAYVTGTTGTIAPVQGYVLKVNSGGGSVGYGPVLLGRTGSSSLQTVGFGIALDSADNAYVTGMTSDSSFPQITGTGAQKTFGGGSYDGFAVKLSSSGSLPPVYGTYIGGLGTNILPERGSGIGVDVDGYAYVSGTTQCIDFPTANTITNARNGGPAVLMKGSVTGNTSTWTATSLAGSFDQVTALAVSGSTVYAGTSAVNATGGGIYKSMDGGTTWAASNSGVTTSTIDAIAVDPNNASNVYAAGGGHIYKSTNAGTSWTELSQAIGSAGTLAISSTTIYVGSNTGLLYSTNGGSSWTAPPTSPAPVNSIVIYPGSTTVAFAASNLGVFQTTNSGANWTQLVNGSLPSSVEVTSLAITGGATPTLYAATPSGLFYIPSGGTWTATQISGVNYTPQLLAVDAANTIYAAIVGSGISVGINGGTTSGDWSALTYSGLTRNAIVALAPGATTGTVFAGIVAATDAFLTRISPDGSTFSFSTCIGGSDNDLGQNIAVTNTGTVYVAGATASTNVPVKAGTVQTALAGGYDDFVARVDNVPFTDVAPTNAFFTFINSMYELGITAGCTANPPQYCPDSTTTRGQMAVFLITAIEGSNNFSYTTTPYFTDVPASNPFFRFIQKLKDLGITSGCSATQFCPDDPITRGQMAVFVIKARYGTINFSYPTTPPYFTDVPASNPFFPFVQKMAQTGITAGCAPNLYCPDQSLTRGQMAVFIITGLINQLLPVTAPVVTQVDPASASPGQTITVTISGMATNFAQGTSVVTVPSGITASNVTVSSPTSLTVQLVVSPSATPSNTAPAGSPYSIVVTTGSEEAMIPNGFIVE